MNTESDQVALGWVPATGHQLRKAGVHFDAVRVDGETGQALADLMERLTGGRPGPVIAEASGRRSTTFLVPPGSTGRHPWPGEAERITSGMGKAGYIRVPAVHGRTWPLTWRCPPGADGHLVHALLLRNALWALVD